MGANVEVALTHGAEGTYCVITHPAEVSKHVVGFLKKTRSAML